MWKCYINEMFSYRIEQGSYHGGWNQTTVGFGKILRPTGATERNLGSVTSHTVRWDHFLLNLYISVIKPEAAVFFSGSLCFCFFFQIGRQGFYVKQEPFLSWYSCCSPQIQRFSFTAALLCATSLLCRSITHSCSALGVIFC